MSDTLDSHIADLPPPVQRALRDLVAAAAAAFTDKLKSVVLFGSAAEGRLRPTSDVNVIVVLSAFERAAADRIRDVMRLAQAAVGLEAMFLLEGELPRAVESFAVKFADVLRRRRVLHGADPFAGVTVSRPAEIARVRQVLLNLSLRLREQYVLRSLRPEQATAALAEAAGPLRACAGAILELEGKPAGSPKEALETIAAGLGDYADMLAHMTAARQQQKLPPTAGPADLFAAGELAAKLQERSQGLS